MHQRALEDSSSFILSERRCACSEQPEHPPSLLMLVLVSNVCSNGLNVVHTGDAGTDELVLVGIEKCFRRKFLADPSLFSATHGASRGARVAGAVRTELPHKLNLFDFVG